MEILGLLQNIRLLPSHLLAWLHCLCESLQHSCFEIPEFNGRGGVDVNDLYRQVTLYLNTINPGSTCCRLSLSRSKSSTGISFSVAPHQTFHDAFCSHRISWTHRIGAVEGSIEGKRSFTLRIPQALLSPYLDHVAARASDLERVLLERRLFTNDARGMHGSGWSSVPFRHPSTFETLALEPEVKKLLTEDLTAFAGGREFYKKTGRAWRRGYLLYGPPGAGKSSLIAAMANFLRYDVYDLELGKVRDNSELRSLLSRTTNRSIIAIEDIDRSVDPSGDGASVKLSGLLTDGLRSCCGEERVVVITANHQGAVGPALRMDVQVSLGACGAHALRAMARNYLGVESHALLDAAEDCTNAGGALAPARIGEIMLRNRRDADVAMSAVVSAMQARIMGADVDGG